MPIEDIDFLKARSVKQSYVFLVDSKDRDRAVYPNPSEYLVRFDTPYRNVCGLEVLEATIPRTMYNVDVTNNSISFCIYAHGYEPLVYETRRVAIGDYSLQTLLPVLNEVMKMPVLGGDNSIIANITAAPLSSPPDVRNTIVFTCPYPFVLDMHNSTISETLGFDLFTSPQESLRPIAEQRYVGLTSNPRLYGSVNREWPVIGPSSIVFEGPRGVLRSESLTTTDWVAQRWTAPFDGLLTGLDVGLTTQTQEMMDEMVVWALYTNSNSTPNEEIASGVIAISQVDGGFSDATLPRDTPIRVDGGSLYWIVLRNDDNIKPARVFYNDVIAQETTFLKSSNGVDGPWFPAADTTGGIYYHMSVRVSISEAYHRVEAPGIVSLVGERYVTLRCPEIEDNMLRSMSYGHLGLAKLRLGVMGFSENRVDYNKITLREFHPIGKLSRMLLKFESADGQLYDFKGVNHTIIFALHYHEPVQKEKFERSRLNPHYDGNFHAYLYNQDEQEEESDDQSVDYNEDGDTFNAWKAAQQRNLPEQRHLQDIEALRFLQHEEDEISTSSSD